MALVNNRADVPVTINESKCTDGCRLCVDMCPLDSLTINPESGKAYMHVDVRRAAVSVLTEAMPAGFEFALVRAMGDDGVRDAPAAGLRELVEVVPASDALREPWSSRRRERSRWKCCGR